VCKLCRDFFHSCCLLILLCEKRTPIQHGYNAQTHTRENISIGQVGPLADCNLEHLSLAVAAAEQKDRKLLKEEGRIDPESDSSSIGSTDQSTVEEHNTFQQKAADAAVVGPVVVGK